jgi:tetratricopeptide (TPR) repeat protein
MTEPFAKAENKNAASASHVELRHNHDVLGYRNDERGLESVRMTAMTYDAFISYASPDLTCAEEVNQRLTTAGFAVWFDKVRLRPGFDWHREIEQACENSRVLIPILTPNWKLSEWTRFETYGAESVIPLIVEGSPAEIFTPPLMRFHAHAVDFRSVRASDSEDNPHWPGDSDTWERLFAALRALLDRPQPDKLARLADVRYRANPYFMGRERELNQLHEQLHQCPTAVLTQGQVRAIAALGGVGKTTLARQYVEKFWRCYPQIFWIDCRLGIESELARICDSLFPEFRSSVNVPDKARFALRELERRDDRLMVLDNAEDERSVQQWIPKTGNCRTLITSRFTDWSAAVQVVLLDVLEPEAAHELLAKRAERHSLPTLADSEQAACMELARELGYLPLALEQAAAYIQQQGAGFGFGDYLQLYRVATEELLAAGVLGSTEYPDSVITTWKTTTAKLSPAARGILRLCSFLAPTPLPFSALLDGIDFLREEAVAVSGEVVPPATSAEFWIRQQVGQLRAYSMADADGHSLRFHTLVQTVERLQLDEASGERPATLRRCLEWMDHVFVGDTQDVRSWTILKPLQHHISSLVSHSLAADTHIPTDRLLNDLGMFLYAKSQYSDSEILLRKAVVASEETYGNTHLNFGIRLGNLALVLQAVNRLAEAESLLWRAIQVFRASRNENHRHFATLLNNLATLLHSTNRPAEAERLLRGVLEIEEHVYGGDHPRVASRLANLAQILHATGRWSEAESLMRRALEIDQRAYGDDHPYVAKDLNNLALLLCDKGEHAQAEPLMRRALSIDEQACGPHHPHVAIDLGNLAKSLLALNRTSEAEPLLRRALAIDEACFGVDHPNVARGLGNLAQLLQRTDRMEAAEPLMERAVTIYEKSLGVEHPDLATALNNLAGLYHATARFAEAEPLFRRALAIDERSLGPNHPQVARDLNNLASVLQATDRPALAESLYVRALEIDERALGPDHPSVARDLNNLAQVLLAINRFEEAGSMMRRALSIEEQCWGADHPNVAIRLYNLAHALATGGRFIEAQPIMARAVETFQRCSEVAGHEHPYLCSAMENYQELLEVVRLSQGR